MFSFIHPRFPLLAAALLALPLEMISSGQAAAAEPSAEAERLLQTAQQALSVGHWDDAARALAAAEKLPVNAELQGRLATFRRDLLMVVRLEEIRCEYPVNQQEFDWRAVIADYRKVFRDYDLNPEKTLSEEMEQRIRRSPIRASIVAALDYWASIVLSQDKPACCQLLAVAAQLDDSSLRCEVRAAVHAADRPRLLKLAKRTDPLALTLSTLLLLAEALDGMDETAAKLDLLRRGRQCYPNDFSINLTLGRALFDQCPLRVGTTPPERKQPLDEEALNCFRAAVTLRPNEAYPWFGLCFALTSLKHFPEAEAAARETIRLRPHWDQAYTLLSVVLNYQEKYAQAEAASHEAIRLNINNTEAQCMLARILSRQDKWSEAETIVRRALRRKKDDSELNGLLADILTSTGKFSEAEPQLREALRLSKGSINWCYLQRCLGLVLILQDHWAEAETVLQQAVDHQKDFEAYTYLAHVFTHQGKNAEAETACREALLLDPKSSVAQTMLFSVLMSQYKVIEAELVCREALRTSPHEGRLYNMLGVTLCVQERCTEAEASFQEAMRCDPKDLESLNNLIALLGLLERYEEIVAVVREALGRNLESADLRFKLSVALQQLGRFEAAFAELQKVKVGELTDLQMERKLRPTLERQVELERRLPALLSGESKPSGVGETLALAQMCFLKARPAAAVRFYEEAFQSYPPSWKELVLNHREVAAYAAVAAGCGQGEDGPASPAERLRLRQQALAWMREELATWTELADTEDSEVRSNIIGALLRWKRSKWFCPVREATMITWNDILTNLKRDKWSGPVSEATAVTQLPDEERAQWTQFWIEVEALRQHLAEQPSIQPIE